MTQVLLIYKGGHCPPYSCFFQLETRIPSAKRDVQERSRGSVKPLVRYNPLLVDKQDHLVLPLFLQ